MTDTVEPPVLSELEQEIALELRNTIAHEEAQVQILEKPRAEHPPRGTTTPEAIDTVRLTSKPDFPTVYHRQGAAEAVSRIRHRVPAKSHHGDPCCSPVKVIEIDGHNPRTHTLDVVATTCYKANPLQGWISFKHRSPFSKSDRDFKLWRFTEEDIAALAEVLQELGVNVINSWPHDEGASFVVELPEPEDA